MTLNGKQGSPKNDMLIMSEVRKSSLAFMPGELNATPPLPLSASPSLAVTLSVFFYLSLSSFLYTTPHRPCGIEALRQQCKSRRDELLMYTLNLGWQGGQKK